MHPESQTTRNVSSLKPNDGWRVWWMLLRPHTLTAAFVPVMIGTLLALLENSLHIGLFLAMLLASILIQSATNMFNEYFDYKRGLDTKESVGIGGAIVRNGIKPKTVLYLGFSFFGISIILGVYICLLSSWWIAVVGLICMAAGYFYTGGPIPIAYTPFGELMSGFFMGVIIILISFFIQTGTITFTTVLHSIPIAITIAAILLANNIRDLDGDKKNGRKTLAILIGRQKAITLLAGMFITAYLFVLFMILFGYTTWWSFLVLLSIPKATFAVKQFIGKTKPIEMMPAMKATAETNTLFGFLLSIGLIIQFITL
ncbi:1,4-dihydroxy-2-naphthoate polyprenyltransferase [Aeribacillus alveayuensis]|uniref:1,4-dihydroxy-2-naphthoate octaprenyltransferase n=1 Tax=Aeribacillus alveayuensis TaxID=279215 RepID=A0ABT9VIY9_9BACI|nr:1,4-dihydroxy-2-naphthoate octaprenyltransferase [Bacillus alveayuensis]